MVVFKHSTALINQLTAHIFGEISDVCLIGSKREFVLDPSVGILSGQDSVLPDQVECPVCPDSQVAQISVCKRALGNLGTPVYPHIGIALRVMLAYIQLVAVWIFAVHISCISQYSSAAAVRTLIVFFFVFMISPLKTEMARACLHVL